MSEIRVLCLGVEPDVQHALSRLLIDAELECVSDQGAFDAKFESWSDGLFAAAFCGNAIPSLPPTELAQAISASCPVMPKYFVTADNSKFEPRNLIKNGMNAVFLLPADLALLKRIIAEKVLTRRAGQVDLRAVKVIDIDPQALLDFDIYIHLPLNGKHIRFAAKDKAIGQARYERLADKHHNSVLIDNQDLPKFYRQSAQTLRNLTDGQSSTEKQTKLNEAVRSVILEIYDQSALGDFSESKKFVETCQGMISNYITKGTSGDWYARLLNAVGESEDVYNHAGNVSTFAALFAMVSGHPNPDELAIAGLFHDIGLNELPAPLLVKDYDSMALEEQAAYQKHIVLGLETLKRKKIILSPMVEKAILQHHEKFSGTGYPKQISSHRFCAEGQLLSFADQFDELTRVASGQPRRSPLDAFRLIKASGSIGPELLSKIAPALDPANAKPA